MALDLQNVGVLLGGRSAERDISLRTGRGVLEALARRGIPAIGVDPLTEPLDELHRQGVTAVFIALHGRFGEDGTVQGALEWMGLPYTGSGVMASAISMDKGLTKRIWSSMGIPTPPYELVDQRTNAQDLVSRLGLPLAIKPVREGSSIGFTKITAAADLSAAVRLALEHDEVVMAEAFVTGREFTIGLLGGGPTGPVQALPVVEIEAPGGQYDYQRKYFGDETRYHCPASLSPQRLAHFQARAVEAFEACGCEGWARVDLLWDGHATEPMLLEINTIPGLTDHSLVPMAARAAGMYYDELVLTILKTARLKVGAAQLG